MQYRRSTYVLNQKRNQESNKVVALTYRGVSYDKSL